MAGRNSGTRFAKQACAAFFLFSLLISHISHLFAQDVVLKRPDSMYVESLIAKSLEFSYIHPDSSMHYATLALSKALERRDLGQTAWGHELKGDSHWEAKEYQQALEEYSMAYWYFVGERNDFNRALILQEMSRVYIEQGRFMEGRIALEEAIHIGRGLQETGLLSRLFHAMGNLLHIIGQDEEGLQYHRQSLRINLARDHKAAISANYNNLGNLYLSLGNLDSALSYYRAALVIKEELGNPRGIILTKSNLGNVLNQMDSLKQGEILLREAVQEGDRQGLKTWGTAAKINLADNFRRQRMFPAAIALSENLLVDTAMASPHERVEVYDNLALIYQEQQQHRKANKYLKLYHALRDSLDEAEDASRFYEMEQRLIAQQNKKGLVRLRAEKEVQAMRLENRTAWVYVLLSIALLVAVLAGTLFLRYRIKNRAHKQQQAMNRMRSRFFANVAHEFKTPIGLILGPLARIKEDKGISTETADWIDISQRNGQQLLELTHQLLDLSRLEVGKMPLRMADVHIRPLFEATGRSFLPLAEQGDINLRIELPEANWWGRFDRQALQKIANNLLSNALRHTPEGGAIDFRVSLQPQDAGQRLSKDRPTPGALRISISDTGEGIPAAQLADIFRPFYQADSTRNQQGSGIGLSLVKELVELQDGEISVESVVGEGTTFEMVLPSPLAWKAEVEEAVESVPEISPDGQSPLVLIADDNADYRKLLKAELGGAFQVVEASDGKAALELARSYPVELLVTDMMMPEMSGMELCKAMKGAVETSHIPVIILTGLEDVELRLEALSHGAEAYLQKPAPPGEVHIRARNLVDQRRALRERWTEQPAATVESIAENDVDKAFLRRAREVVLERLSDSGFDVQAFCKEMGMSRPALFRKMKALAGQNISEFIRAIRLRQAAEWLREPSANVSDVAYRVGFSNPSYFSRSFKALYGVSPKEFSASASSK